MNPFLWRSPRKLYRAMAVVGLFGTWYFNVQFFAQGGSLAPAVFFGAALANPLSTAITLDVYWCALTFLVWVGRASPRDRVGRNLLVWGAVSLGVGLAVALPLYLASIETAPDSAPEPGR